MAKACHSDVLDGALNVISASVNIAVCSAQPTTRTEADSTLMLAKTTMSSGDFTIANGTVSGRKVTMGQKTNISITNNGTATHIALYDGTRLLYVTTCTSQALTAGGTVTIPSWKIEIAAPS